MNQYISAYGRISKRAGIFIPSSDEAGGNITKIEELTMLDVAIFQIE